MRNKTPPIAPVGKPSRLQRCSPRLIFKDENIKTSLEYCNGQNIQQKNWGYLAHSGKSAQGQDPDRETLRLQFWPFPVSNPFTVLGVACCQTAVIKETFRASRVNSCLTRVYQGFRVPPCSSLKITQEEKTKARGPLNSPPRRE